MKKFKIAISNENGSSQKYTMKEWLRQNPHLVPQGLSATDSTSHELRRGLKKKGWSEIGTEQEVVLVHPDYDIKGNLEQDFEEEILSDEPEKSTVTFGLEFQLRDYISENIGSFRIHNKKLSLYVSPEGRDGVEYPTSVGFIDILAHDEEKNFYVFELKRQGNSDRAIGQLARYMGWVKTTIGKEKKVNGVVVASQIDEKLRYAASVIPEVSLFEYSVEFHLHDANKI